MVTNMGRGDLTSPGRLTKGGQGCVTLNKRLFKICVHALFNHLVNAMLAPHTVMCFAEIGQAICAI